MPTDEERRKVVRELRKRSHVVSVQSVQSQLHEILGVGGADIFGKLADLIEPPTQCPYYHSDRHHCSAYDDVVDRDALLELADKMLAQQYMREDARLLRWDVAARRVREALGVSQ